MDREFTRRELYELVWSQPMKNIAADLGISDVALAKHCKKAGIPVPSRGYWARKQAGKSTIRTDLPPRFPGASDRAGGSKQHHHFWTSDWPEKILEMAVPPVPTFEEDLATVEKRARKLVGKVQCPGTFEIVHPLVAKLLAHDDERRKEFKKWHSNYYAPKYDAGIERRRLLIINALFTAASNLGCLPSMSTSKYGPDTARQINIKIGESRIGSKERNWTTLTSFRAVSGRQCDAHFSPHEGMSNRSSARLGLASHEPWPTIAISTRFFIRQVRPDPALRVYWLKHKAQYVGTVSHLNPFSG